MAENKLQSRYFGLFVDGIDWHPKAGFIQLSPLAFVIKFWDRKEFNTGPMDSE